MRTRLTIMIASLFLSVTLGLVLSRDSSTKTKTSDKLVIGLSMDTLKEARWQTDRDSFIAAAEAAGAEVRVQSANSNDQKQRQDIESLISAGVDVMVIIPHDGQAMAAAVDSCFENNIPVISYDRLITGTPNLDIYITFDNVRVGELQAQYLVDHLFKDGKTSAKIVRIYGSPTDNNAKLFKQGQDNILEPLIASGRIEVVHEDWAQDWQPQNAKKITNAAITRLGAEGFEGILASNDGTAGGAITALAEEGLAGKIAVTGQDADLPALQRILAGTQAMTVYKPVKTLAATAAELAVKMAKGRPVIAKEVLNNGAADIPSVFASIVAVDKTNMMETVVKDGFHPFEDIYAAVPEDQRPERKN